MGVKSIRKFFVDSDIPFSFTLKMKDSKSCQDAIEFICVDDGYNIAINGIIFRNRSVYYYPFLYSNSKLENVMKVLNIQTTLAVLFKQEYNIVWGYQTFFGWLWDSELQQVWSKYILKGNLSFILNKQFEVSIPPKLNGENTMKFRLDEYLHIMRDAIPLWGVN